MRRPFAAESIATIQKIRFEDRFQYQERWPSGSTRSRIGRYAQWPQLPVCLLYPHSPYRLRLGSVFCFSDCSISSRNPFDSAVAFLDHRQSIVPSTPGAPSVGPHPFPCRFQRVPPIDPVIQHVKPELRLLLRLSDLASVSVERVSPASRFWLRFPAPQAANAGSSVVGLSSKRFSPPLTVARLHSAPSLHGRYPLPRYYGLSDSREKKTSRVSQVPRLHLSSRAAPNHPGESDGCYHPLLRPSMAGFIRFDRLATLIGVNEAESGSLSLRLVCLPCKAS